jgi:hypothetical protein
MKKAIIIFMAVFMVSCGFAQFAQTIMLKDSNGNKYSLTAKYDDTVHQVGMSICFENKCYSCEAVYDKEFDPSALMWEIDLDVLAKTGMGLFVYKGQKYSCKVE